MAQPRSQRVACGPSCTPEHQGSFRQQRPRSRRLCLASASGRFSRPAACRALLLQATTKAELTTRQGSLGADAAAGITAGALGAFGPFLGAKGDLSGTAEARAGVKASDSPRTPFTAEAALRASGSVTGSGGLYLPGATKAKPEARGAADERVALPADRLRLFGALARRRRRRSLLR